MSKRIQAAACLCVTLCAFSLTAHAATYYVSPSGNDSKAGTSSSYPWKTISRVNKGTYKAGDKILFRGGSTFSGNIYLHNRNTSGTPSAPITLGSYGTGRATLSAGAGHGINLYNKASFVITDLNIVGSGVGTNNGAGVNCYADLSGGVLLPYLRIRNLSVSGFRSGGVLVGSWNGATGYSDVEITNVTATNNGKAGIMTYAAQRNVHRNVYVGSCLAYNNAGIPGSTAQTGNGIALGSVNGGLIERCVAHHNGAANSAAGGPVGILVVDSTYVIVQHCESYANTTGGKADGDGFDLDINVSNSILQYNYSHDNMGAGFLMAHGPNNYNHTGNIIRYNISQNDARKLWGYGGIHIYGRTTNAEIHNNVVYMKPSTISGSSPRAIVLCNYGIESQDLKSVHFRNNIIQTTGGVPVLEVTAGVVSGSTDVLFQRNNYYPTGSTLKIQWGGKTYTSLSAWQSAAGAQEKVSGSNVGLSTDPRFVLPGGAGTVNNASLLESALGAYKLKSGSPMVNKGLNLAGGPYYLSIGTRDFFGNSIPKSSGYDLGAHEL